MQRDQSTKNNKQQRTDGSDSLRDGGSAEIDGSLGFGAFGALAAHQLQARVLAVLIHAELERALPTASERERAMRANNARQ